MPVYIYHLAKEASNISEQSCYNFIMNTLIICRLCAEEDKNCVDVFSEDGNKYNIEKKIRMCLPLKIYENDDMPKQVCLSCLNKLDTCYELYCGCLSAQTTIKKLYESTKKNNSQTAIQHNNEQAKECLISQVVDFNSKTDEGADSFIKIGEKTIKLQDYLLHKDSFDEPLMKSRRLDCIPSDSNQNQLNTSCELTLHTNSQGNALQHSAVTQDGVSSGGLDNDDLPSLYILNEEQFAQSAAEAQNNMPYLESHLLSSSSPKLFSEQTSLSGAGFGFNLTTPSNPKATFPQYLGSNDSGTGLPLEVRKQNISGPFRIPHSNHFSNYEDGTVPTILTLSDTTNNKGTQSNPQNTQFAVLPPVPIQQNMFVLDTDMEPLNIMTSSNNSLHHTSHNISSIQLQTHKPYSNHQKLTGTVDNTDLELNNSLNSFNIGSQNIQSLPSKPSLPSLMSNNPSLAQENLQSSSLFNFLCDEQLPAELSSRTKSPLVPNGSMGTTRVTSQESPANRTAVVGNMAQRTSTVHVPRTTTIGAVVQPSYVKPTMQANMLRSGSTLPSVNVTLHGYTSPIANVAPQARSALLTSQVGPSLPLAHAAPRPTPSVLTSNAASMTSNAVSMTSNAASMTTNVASVFGAHVPQISNVMSIPTRPPLANKPMSICSVMSIPRHASQTSGVGLLVPTNNTMLTANDPSPTTNMPSGSSNLTSRASSVMIGNTPSTLTDKFTPHVANTINTAMTPERPSINSENSLRTSSLLRRSTKQFPPQNAVTLDLAASDSESSDATDGGMYDDQDEVVLSDTESLTAENVLLRTCEFCRKQFPEHIIDHHRSLHFRDHFYSCIDCNKNFRTSQGLETHRCLKPDEAAQNTK